MQKARSCAKGPSLFPTSLFPNLAKHPEAKLRLTPQEKADLIAFPKTLTDESFAGIQPAVGVNGAGKGK